MNLKEAFEKGDRVIAKCECGNYAMKWKWEVNAICRACSVKPKKRIKKVAVKKKEIFSKRGIKGENQHPFWKAHAKRMKDLGA